MLKYELKKMILGRSGKIALVALIIILLVASYSSVSSMNYVDEEGELHKGIWAARQLENAKMQWTGLVDTEMLQKVIARNDYINHTPNALSDDYQLQDKAYSQKQGYSDLKEMINQSFTGFSEYDYYRIDTVSVDEVGNAYKNRIQIINDWLADSGEENFAFTPLQKDFVEDQINSLDTPFYYEPFDGYSVFFQYSSMVIILSVVVLSLLVSGIFPKEHQQQSDAILFSTYHGRGKGIRAKIQAGFLLTTIVYWVMMGLFALIIFSIFGNTGGDIPIQIESVGWKSLYNVTFFQKFLMIIFGGYLGTLFMLSAVMLLSILTRSAVVSIVFPFAAIFLPAFLTSFELHTSVWGLLPGQLLQVDDVTAYYYLYTIGDRVFLAFPLLLLIYGLLTAILVPLIYKSYQNSKVI